ncbi:hypothetical protein HK405_002898 [Cladochytrium tenue]|nr:hypothetical protein HK405_002898 [Cladochytrium tenue]
MNRHEDHFAKELAAIGEQLRHDQIMFADFLSLTTKIPTVSKKENEGGRRIAKRKARGKFLDEMIKIQNHALEKEEQLVESLSNLALLSEQLLEDQRTVHNAKVSILLRERDSLKSELAYARKAVIITTRSKDDEIRALKDALNKQTLSLKRNSISRKEESRETQQRRSLLRFRRKEDPNKHHTESTTAEYLVELEEFVAEVLQKGREVESEKRKLEGLLQARSAGSAA